MERFFFRLTRKSDQQINEEYKEMNTALSSYCSQMSRLNGSQAYHLGLREMTINYLNIHGSKQSMDTASLIRVCETTYRNPATFYGETESNISQSPVSDDVGKILARDTIFRIVFSQLDYETYQSTAQPYLDAFFLLTKGAEGQSIDEFRDHVVEVYTQNRHNEDFSSLRQITQDILITLS